MNLKKFLGMILGIFALCVISGCGQEPEKQEVRELTIGLMPDTESLPFLAASKSGYFEAEGIEVKLQYFKSAMDRDAALQSGNLDGTLSDMLAVGFLKSGDVDVKITSGTDGRYILVAAGNSGVKTMQDLKGKEVAISRNTIIEYTFDAMCKEEGIQEGEIRKAVIPQIPVRLEMLKSGQVAAALLPDPMASIAVAQGGIVLNTSERLGIQPGVIVFTGKAMEEKPKTIAAMYRAYNKATGDLNAHASKKWLELAISELGFPAEVRGVLELPEYRQADLPLEKDFSDSMDWLESRGLLKQRYEYKNVVVPMFGK